MGPLIWARSIPATLGRDDQSFWIRKQGFGNQFLADMGTVGIGSIDEVDLHLNRFAENRECGFAIRGRTPDAFAGKAHSSKAKTMDRKLTSEANISGQAGRNPFFVVIQDNLLSSRLW